MKIRDIGVLLLLVVLFCVPSACARSSADQPTTVTIEGVVDARPVQGAGSNNAVEIFPQRVVAVELAVTNETDENISVRRARLFGRAFGVTFVAYDALLTASIPPGESRTLEIPVEFIDLERQATGLLPGGFALYGDDRQLLGEEEFVLDVRGSVTSALGLFGLVVTAATVVGLIGIVIAVKRGTLGASRARRAWRFALVGLGAGLSAVVGLAVFRVLAPSGTVWVPVTLVPMLFGAILGFLSPGPLALDDEADHDDEADLDTEIVDLTDDGADGSHLPGGPGAADAQFGNRESHPDVVAGDHQQRI